MARSMTELDRKCAREGRCIAGAPRLPWNTKQKARGKGGMLSRGDRRKFEKVFSTDRIISREIILKGMYKETKAA